MPISEFEIYCTNNTAVQYETRLKKNDKKFYLPKNKPKTIIVLKFNFFTIEGKGNLNNDFLPITLVFYIDVPTPLK